MSQVGRQAGRPLTGVPQRIVRLGWLVGQFPLFSEDIANVMYKLTLELISYRETGRQLAFLDVGNAEIVNTCTFNVITETTQRDADMCVCVYLQFGYCRHTFEVGPNALAKEAASYVACITYNVN